MSALRSLLAASRHTSDLSRLSNDQVLHEAAVLLTTGQLVLGWERILESRTAGGPKEERAPASEPAPAPVRAQPAGRAQEPDPATYPAGHDGAVQAAVLTAAAAEGVPFCEVCAKAAGAARN